MELQSRGAIFHRRAVLHRRTVSVNDASRQRYSLWQLSPFEIAVSRAGNRPGPGRRDFATRAGWTRTMPRSRCPRSGGALHRPLTFASRMKTQPLPIIIALTAALPLPAAAPAKNPDRTIDSSSAVLKEFLDLQVKQIPAGLLADAHGVAIVPDAIKVGLLVGGQRGHGVVIVREKDGSWRAPTFMTLTGGSIGWQIGAQATDFVLVFKTQKSVEGLLRGKFTLGADAAIAAGPVGRRVGAGTDAELKAEI